MASQVRLSLTYRAIPTVYPSRNVLVFAFLAIGLAPFEPTLATPITFRFDGTVTHALAGNPFDLPFTYQVGEVISGKLTFEPGVGVSTGDNSIEAQQFLGLEFVVNGTTFGTSAYSIRVFDNDLIIADDPDITDGLVADTMVLQCSASSTESCMPELISGPSGSPYRITVRMDLTGEKSILNTPIVRPEAEIWNAFSFRRRLTITFNDETGGSMLLGATVGPFTVIPEPTTSSIFVWTSMTYLISGWTFRRTRSSAKRRVTNV
jgi:hypothetical protein